MNPFALGGIWFLLFFSFMGAVLLGGLVWVRQAWEPDPALPVRLTDPYEIACLRGGYSEVLRLATAGLIDRALLEVEGGRLRVCNRELASMVQQRVERAILDHFWTGADRISLFSSAGLRHSCEPYETSLQQRGLIAGRDARRPQLFTAAGAIGVLWITAVARLRVVAAPEPALSNLLLIVTLALSVAALSIAMVRKTRRGNRFLAEIQVTFAPLRRSAQGRNTNDFLLTGAVYGIAKDGPVTSRPFSELSCNGGGCSCGFCKGQ